jgi:hypothetical protein
VLVHQNQQYAVEFLLHINTAKPLRLRRTGRHATSFDLQAARHAVFESRCVVSRLTRLDKFDAQEPRGLELGNFTGNTKWLSCQGAITLNTPMSLCGTVLVRSWFSRTIKRLPLRQISSR